MKRTTLPLLFFLLAGMAKADALHVSSKEPINVIAPTNWKTVRDKPPSEAFPFETYRVMPPAGRNALLLISIFDKDNRKFIDPQFLKALLKGDSRPYVRTPTDLAKIELKDLKINGGIGFYANFVDPDLVGKPAKQGSYRTATPIILSIGSKYLVKVTILCDEIDGADYRDAIQIVESIQIRQDNVR
jgi:hypothetical protein